MSAWRCILTCALASLATALAGCQSTPASFAAHDGMPSGSRSIVMPAEDIAPVADGRAWYDIRNDARLTTSAGYQSPVLETQVTYTYDRQSQYGHRVHDHFAETTRRVRVQQTIR